LAILIKSGVVLSEGTRFSSAEKVVGSMTSLPKKEVIVSYGILQLAYL
jgi:hypothetical protein